jgi:DNA repair protein RadC
MIIHDLSNNHIQAPEDAASIIQSWLNMLDDIAKDKEHFFVLILDSRNKLKFLELCSVGTMNASLVHPREVFRRAITEAGASIMIAHNHPSGDVEPSDADISITRRLGEVGKLVGIELRDHLIVSSASFYSFRERGRL